MNQRTHAWLAIRALEDEGAVPELHETIMHDAVLNIVVIWKCVWGQLS